MTRLAIPLFCLLLLAASPALGDEGTKILSFAEALAADGDHYRAITEYKRFLHLFPEAPEAASALLSMAESYAAGERWDDAERTARRIVEEHSDGPETRRAARLLAEIALRRNDFPTARHRYRLLIEETDDPAEERELRHRLAWGYIERERFREARDVLAPLPDPSSKALSGELAQLSELPLKSPGLAGGLSAILPGAGQLYAGRPRDAALAFLLNAAFLWGAIDAFEDGNEAAGAILLFFEAGWYSGNIFNAVNSTHKHNRELRRKATEPLRKRFGPALSRHGSTPVFGLSGRF